MIKKLNCSYNFLKVFLLDSLKKMKLTVKIYNLSIEMKCQILNGGEVFNILFKQLRYFAYELKKHGFELFQIRKSFSC